MLYSVATPKSNAYKATSSVGFEVLAEASGFTILNVERIW
jgi:hypothetical protein